MTIHMWACRSVVSWWALLFHVSTSKLIMRKVFNMWTQYEHGTQEPIITVPFLLHNEYLEICLFIPVFKWRVNPFKWRVSRFCSTFHQALYYTLSWQVSGCINFANIIFVNHPTLKLPQSVIVSFLMKQ